MKKLTPWMSGFGVFALVAVLATTSAAAPALAPTPPMGWNSWNKFADKVDDAIVRAMADALVSSGMRDAGYVYVNIDDTWQGERDAKGVLHPNKKFPDMKALGDYIHSKGLKFGMYASPGTKTCAGYAGSMGYEEQDAQMFADWGVDYLKYDLCSYNDEVINKASTWEEKHRLMKEACEKMHRAILKTGRPMVYSICQYGLHSVWQWGESVGGNLWRTTGDIGDNYDRMADIGFSQAGLAKYAKPGHWNDPDMLEVGNGGMKDFEYETHMTLWAILAAPLVAGNDLTKMTPETVAMLTNRDVIAIDQDPAGIQGDRVWAEGPFEIWMKPLADGSKAIGVFNRQESWMPAHPVTVDFAKLGFKGAVKARDVWKKKDLGELTTYTPVIQPHGCVLLRVRAAKD